MLNTVLTDYNPSSTDHRPHTCKRHSPRRPSRFPSPTDHRFPAGWRTRLANYLSAADAPTVDAGVDAGAAALVATPRAPAWLADEFHHLVLLAIVTVRPPQVQSHDGVAQNAEYDHYFGPIDRVRWH